MRTAVLTGLLFWVLFLMAGISIAVSGIYFLPKFYDLRLVNTLLIRTTDVPVVKHGSHCRCVRPLCGKVQQVMKYYSRNCFTKQHYRHFSINFDRKPIIVSKRAIEIPLAIFNERVSLYVTDNCFIVKRFYSPTLLFAAKIPDAKPIGSGEYLRVFRDPFRQ